MRTTLLTGSSGFVGSGILEWMLEHTDWEFTCLCSWRHNGNPLNIKPNPRVQVVTLDLTGPIPDLGHFDTILHLAAESHVDRSIASPVTFIETNVSSTLQVLEYARRHTPDVVICFGTDEVFGAAEHAEWDVLLPSNPYAASKAAAEMCAIAYWATYKIPAVLTNSNNIVGPNQHPEKFIPKLVERISRGDTVEIHVTDGVPGRRHYNSVRNVASALLFIIENPQPTTDRPNRFSLGGGEEVDNLAMAQRIAILLGQPLDYTLVEATSVRPAYDEFYPKTDGALSALGWRPTYDLDDELKRVIASVRSQA